MYGVWQSDKAHDTHHQMVLIPGILTLMLHLCRHCPSNCPPSCVVPLTCRWMTFLSGLAYSRINLSDAVTLPYMRVQTSWRYFIIIMWLECFLQCGGLKCKNDAQDTRISSLCCSYALEYHSVSEEASCPDLTERLNLCFTSENQFIQIFVNLLLLLCAELRLFITWHSCS